jgi:hypothetical protein
MRHNRAKLHDPQAEEARFCHPTAIGEASRSFNPARMHLANTYASDLLTGQKDAKTFVERWRINLPHSAEGIAATRRWSRTTSFFSFQWVRIMTLFSPQEEIPTKDKHNNSTS